MTVPVALLAPAGGMLLASAGLIVAMARLRAEQHADSDDGKAPLARHASWAMPGLPASVGLSAQSAPPSSALRRVRLISAVAVGLLVAVTTRWVVAATAAAIATAWLPSLFKTTAAGRRTERLEAIATWTELLRDTLSAAAGLGQAVIATAELAPPAIQKAVTALSARLSNGVAMEDGLRMFAAELEEASGDLVVCALLLAASAQSHRLSDLLGALAQSCREEVGMHLRVEASRASARSSVRTVTIFSLAFASLLFVVAHSYLLPFGTTTGQLVLLVVCGCYAAGLWLMVRLVRPRPAHRLLHDGGQP